MILQRRALKFDSLDDVVRDTEALLASGYDKVGNWNLAQICGHLASWMSFPLDGFPKPPVFVRIMMWGLRNTVGPVALRTIMAKRKMPTGSMTDPTTIPAQESDETAAVERLKAAAARFQAWTGVIVPSPFFGPMNKDEATALQRVHCEHHLSFLIPKQ